MPNRSPLLYPQTNQHGFTLLELLVVVGIMAILASTTLYASRTTSIDKAKTTAVTAEMHNIRKALLQYKTDNFFFPAPSSPTQSSPADFKFLFERGSEDAWSNDYQRGWRGPYLSSGDSGLVDIGDNLGHTGSGKPYVIDDNAKNLQRGIPDPFSFAPVANGEAKPSISTPCDDSVNDNDKCLLDWRLVGQDDADAPLPNKGRPYLVFDLAFLEKARIVSMGPNGIYQTGEMVDSDGNEVSCSSYLKSTEDNEDNDDIILCLY